MDPRRRVRLLLRRAWSHRRWTAAALLLLPFLALLIATALSPLPDELRARRTEQSLRIEDRSGALLREVRNSRGALSHWVPLESMPPLLPRLLVAVEDRRFFYHPGVDPIAVLRALVQNVWTLRTVSGASTLTMQLARNLRPHPRSLWGKWGEMALALRIEASLPKARILEEYLNRVDFGPNLRGIGAASLGYFGKPVSSLSLAEIALLAGMPQGPSVYALHRHPARAMARRNRVLERAEQAHLASAAELTAARAEAPHLQRTRPAFGAPHLIAALLTGRSSMLQQGLGGTEAAGASRIRTTIDPHMQRAAESALATVVPELARYHVTAAAAVLVDNASGEVLAYVGSPDFFDSAQQGQVDGVRALRQPGSTLKPFVYAAAIDQLGYTPATVLPDLPLNLNVGGGQEYAPRNFDDKFHGPVRLREALGNSLNIPAVYVANELPEPGLLGTLHRFGFDSLQQTPEFYGPALALGDGEVSLLELVRAYATLARGGRLLPIHAVSQWESRQLSSTTGRPETRQYKPPEVPTAISPVSATLVTDMLADNRARSASFGLDSSLHFDTPVAAKTGTSKGYRDNWVVGYTTRVTLGVWAGNFDGSPMRGVSGITGAGPIFRAIMNAALARYPDAEPLVPSESSVPGGLEPALAPHAGEIPLTGSEGPASAPTLVGAKALEATPQAVARGIRRVQICPVSGQQRGEHCPQALEELVPGNTVLPNCEWHRQLALDRRNGLLAGPACPARFVIEKPFELLPDEYVAWARSEGRPLPPDAYSPHCPEPPQARSELADLFVSEPRHGARYVLDPERPATTQRLTVTVTTSSATKQVSLLVDERLFGTIDGRRRPFEFQWPLQPGTHRFVARDQDGRLSEPVQISVRPAE